MKRALVLILLALAGCGASTPKSLTVSATCKFAGSGLAVAADRGCTPGQWIDKTGSGVCHKGYNPRPPEFFTGPIKRTVMRRYGLPLSALSSYELDHLYPVWLGGATVEQNLWPEPNYSHPVGFDHNPKDKLEFAIYKLVCQKHTMSIAAARRLFAGDWRKAYPKYITGGFNDN